MSKDHTGGRADHAENDTGLDGWTKGLAAVLPLLQLGLTGLGLASGGLQIAALNHPVVLGIGAVAVTIGVVALLFGVLKPRYQKWSLLIGGALMAVGLFGTGYVAIALPQKPSSPTVDIKIASLHPLILRSKVSASGIKRGEVFQIEVNGYMESGHGYVSTRPLLYHAVLGANAAGEISSTAEIPVKARYDAVAIDAWSGSNRGPGPCGFSPDNPGELGYPTGDIPHFGCAVVQVSRRNVRVLHVNWATLAAGRGDAEVRKHWGRGRLETKGASAGSGQQSAHR